MIKGFGRAVTMPARATMMMSLERNGSAVLAPSRTLRAGYAGAVIRHSGRRWRAALWRSPGRDEGMAGWVEQRDGLWRGQSSSDGSGPHGMVRIEDGLPIQHGAGHGEQTIGDAAQGPSVGVTPPAQFGISHAAEYVTLNGHPCPVVDSSAQPDLAGPTHDNEAALAAATGHRSNAGQGAQRVVISPAQRLPGLGEQRGEDDPSDSRQGPQDRHVMLLALLPRRGLPVGKLGGECIEPPVSLLNLSVHQAQTGSDSANVGDRRFGHARRHGERHLLQTAQYLSSIKATNVMGLQDAGDTALAHPRRLGRRRHQMPEIKEPIVCQVVSDFERLRVISPQLFARCG